jgi:hypothetical protein
MNLSKKLDYARQAVDSISRHDDEDAAVRKAMLMTLHRYVESEIAAADARVAVRVEQLAESASV